MFFKDAISDFCFCLPEGNQQLPVYTSSIHAASLTFIGSLAHTAAKQIDGMCESEKCKSKTMSGKVYIYRRRADGVKRSSDSYVRFPHYKRVLSCVCV